MKSPALDAVTAKLERIQRRSPEDFKAFGVLIDQVLERLNQTMAAERGARGRLLSRLQAVHDCPCPAGGQFEQIAPLYGKVRQWQCSGCSKIVTLD
jgi:hypothetical protein